MAAEEGNKSHKNAKARRKAKKDGSSSKPSTPKVHREGGSASVAPEGGGPKRGLVETVVRYFKGVIAESKRVSWPGKPELIAGTISSVLILAAFAAWLGGLDYILGRFVS